MIQNYIVLWCKMALVYLFGELQSKQNDIILKAKYI
jgi:hypothetical protein